MGAPGGASRSAASRAANAGAASGCVALYHRRGWGAPRWGGLLLLRTLACPEAAAEGDRIGASVAVSRDDSVALAAGVRLGAGDAATLSGEPRLVLDDAQGAEVLVFDLAA